jgi:hypothetical protein
MEKGKTKLTIILLTLITILTILILFELPILTAQESSWWNDEWKSKKEIQINGTNAEPISDFSILLSIPYSEKMNQDFSDLRFTNENQDQELGYWIEEKIDNSEAQIWVKLPSISSTQNTHIYMYYNNPSATSTSNFNNAFLYADDFETDTFGKYNFSPACTGAWVQDGKLQAESSSVESPCTIAPKEQYQLIKENYVVETRISTNDLCGYIGVVGYMPNLGFSEGGSAAWILPHSNTLGIIEWPGWETQRSVPISTIRPYEIKLILNGPSEKRGILDNSESVLYSSSKFNQGNYGMAIYSGCNSPQASIEWFKVHPYVQEKPTYLFGEEQEIENLIHNIDYFTSNWNLIGGSSNTKICQVLKAKTDLKIIKWEKAEVTTATNCYIQVGGNGISEQGTEIYSNTFNGNICEVSPNINIEKDQHFQLCFDSAGSQHIWEYNSNISINIERTNVIWLNQSYAHEGAWYNGVQESIKSITTKKRNISGNGGDPTDFNLEEYLGELTQRINLLEQTTTELSQTNSNLNEEITQLKLKDLEQDEKISILETAVSQIENVLDAIIDNMNDFFSNKIKDYLKHLPKKTKKKMLCGYLEENNEQEVQDLGLDCKLKENKKGKTNCSCKKIK